MFICNRLRGEAEAAALEPFEIVRRPLAQRSERIFPGADGRPGTTYESHEVALGRSRLSHRDGGGYVIIMTNGSGVSVVGVPTFYDNGAMMRTLLEAPDAVLYATLYTMWRMADDAATEAAQRTRQQWANAHIDKRIKVKRRSGQRFVEIVPWYVGSASYAGQPPKPVAGRWATAEAAFAAAKAEHPDAASYSATPQD